MGQTIVYCRRYSALEWRRVPQGVRRGRAGCSVRPAAKLKRQPAFAFSVQACAEDDMEGGLIWLGIIAGILGVSGVGYLFAAWAKARRPPR
jgi:hypothetical protein